MRGRAQRPLPSSWRQSCKAMIDQCWWVNDKGTMHMSWCRSANIAQRPGTDSGNFFELAMFLVPVPRQWRHKTRDMEKPWKTKGLLSIHYWNLLKCFTNPMHGGDLDVLWFPTGLGQMFAGGFQYFAILLELFGFVHWQSGKALIHDRYRSLQMIRWKSNQRFGLRAD